MGAAYSATERKAGNVTNEWSKPEHAAAYLARMHDIPHRAAGEGTVLAEIPTDAKRILDLGCGDGHLLALVLAHCPDATGVGLDFSPAMLERAQKRFADDSRATLVEHNLEEPLPDLGPLDCVVSSFAIHHCADQRKRGLYEEVFNLLEPHGVFCNLEHVASPNERVHARFMTAMDMMPEDEDPSNKLLDVETQLQWLKEIGFEDVDCHWKWRELALLAGRKPQVRAAGDGQEMDEAPSQAEVRWLDSQLEAFNQQKVGRDDFQPVNLVIREQGKVVAGLKGLAGWGWLYVRVLWVEESHRHQRLGSRLLERGEQLARERGCIGACLSSFTFQAPIFYERHGYSTFGKIDDYPQDQTLYFMSKRFDAGH